MYNWHPPLQPVEDKDLVVLLDLNNTLVDDRGSATFDTRMADRILMERYDRRLIDLIQGHTVLLCTVRFADWKSVTLGHIKELTGWEPESAYFNNTNTQWGIRVKQAYLEKQIFPEHGLPWNRPYYGVESGSDVRKLYRRLKIECAPVDRNWVKLPYWATRKDK